MKKLLVTLAVLFSASTVSLAGPNAGGTLVVNDANLLMSATDGSVSICGQGTIPSNCDGIDTEIDGAAGADPAVFKVYAAWPEQASPRLLGLTWGVHYPAGVVLTQWGMCGDFELNDANWPASDTGSSVTYPVPQTDLLVPVYWFAGYLYGAPSQLSLRDNPTQGGWFGDDTVPAILDPIAAYGAIGFDMAGVAACPTPLGACCSPDGTCAMVFESQCTAPDVWQGEGTSCDPNPCPQPLGACCFGDGGCTVLSEPDCRGQGGTWLGEGTDCASNPCPQPGACCFHDGICQSLMQAACQQSGGSWLGPDTTCAPNPCPQPGACCEPTGSCSITLESECTDPYVWLGPNTNCSPNPCPQPSGACCFQDGQCRSLPLAECEQYGGSWLGMDTMCEPNPCPQPGACCMLDGSCVITLESECTPPAIWHGAHTVCIPNPCPQPGACCRHDGSCFVSFESECQAPDTWLGPDTGCDPNPCPQPIGACCFEDGTCQLLTQAQCSGVWLGMDTTCTPNPCSILGACCFIDGSCTVTFLAQCTGDWQGPNTTCTPNPCPQMGACCHPDGTCTITLQSQCYSPNHWMGPNTTCVPNPCPVSGACCVGMSCFVVFQQDCAGTWLGPGTGCSPNPCCARPGPLVGRGVRDPRTAQAVGAGHGVVIQSPSPDAICPGFTLKRNDDESYENGYAWAYQGAAEPYFGAWAEGFSLDGGNSGVCGLKLGLTQIGAQDGLLLDAYVWSSDDCGPSTVITVAIGINPGTIGMWPTITQHDIDINDSWVPHDYFVGWWGDWPGSRNGWYVAADENGFGGGLPRTNIAPGIGFPSGWQHPNVVSTFAGCMDLAIAVYEGNAGPTPVKETTWGRIKNMFRETNR